MDKIKNHNKVIIVFFSFSLIVLLIGFSYAFFRYKKTGLYTQSIEGAKMKIIYDEITGNSIALNNAYPMTDEEAIEDALEFEFTVTGYNEMIKNIFYAVEIEHGEDVVGKTRFLDSDMKLTLYENEEVVFENEIFDNLDNQEIAYGTILRETSTNVPSVSNYKLRIWVNDNVLITDTEDMVDVTGKHVYTADEFGNSYTNFRINVKTTSAYNDVKYLTYDANGGVKPPKKTSVLTGKVTIEEPVMLVEKDGISKYQIFSGWSTTKNGEVEYYPGDSYDGEGRMLYAVYSDEINVLDDFDAFKDYNDLITDVYFISDTQAVLNSKYNAAPIKFDLTYNNQGKVLGWLEEGTYDEENSVQYYKLYVGSQGETYLSTGKELFYAWEKVSKMDFANANSMLITDTSEMFMHCWDILDIGRSSEHSVNIEHLDTSNVKNMSHMFSRVDDLVTLDLKGMNTSSVTNMSHFVFSFSSSELTTIDVSDFDTSKVENMEYMFSGVDKITELDVTDWNTSSVTSMWYMFQDCSSLTNLDLSTWDTSKVTLIGGMFSGCEGFETVGPGEEYALNIKGFDTNNVTNMNGIFSGCSNLTNVNLSHFDTNLTKGMGYMFMGCDKLTSAGPGSEYDIDLSSFETSSLTAMQQLFQGCSSMTKIDITHFDTSKVTTMSGVFSGCTSLKSAGMGSEYDVDLSNFITANVTTMGTMFKGCSNLTYLDISHFNTANVTNMEDMFYGCSSLTQIDLSNFDTAKVTTMQGMFWNCSKLTTLDLSNFVTTSLTKMSTYSNYDDGTFGNCSSLTNLYITNFRFANITNYTYAFVGMPKSAIIYVGTTADSSLLSAISTSYRPSNIIVKS